MDCWRNGGRKATPPCEGPNGTTERNAVPLGPRELSRKHVKGENTVERINSYNCNDLQTIIEDAFSQARRICEEATPNGREYLSSVYVHSVHDLRVVSHEEVRVPKLGAIQLRPLPSREEATDKTVIKD